MFGMGKRGSGNAVAVVDVESGSVGVAIFRSGEHPKLIAASREELPPEGRSKNALLSGIPQLLKIAGEKALSEFSKNYHGSELSLCYCILGAPWTHSVAGTAHVAYEKPVTVTDATISDLAKKALAGQKEAGSAALLEASVVRVLLNGYPTSEPSGKKALTVDVFTLASDCEPEAKRAISEGVAALFHDAKILWRSSARAVLAGAKKEEKSGTCLVVELGAEATDLIFIRKGIIDARVPVELGVRAILSSLAHAKPPQETMSLLSMLEKDQCETEACEALRRSIAKAEPELVHLFGEGLAKLSTGRKLPDTLFLVAPVDLLPWLTRFFARIDFTQFTSTARPFSVSTFPGAFSGSGISSTENAVEDPGLSLACELVNAELVS